MSFISWIVFAVVGKLAMFILRKFPPTTLLASKYKTIKDMIECGLCFGVWAYTIMSLIYGVDIYKDLWGNVLIINNLLTGITTSFIVWIFSDGWKARFEVIQI